MRSSVIPQRRAREPRRLHPEQTEYKLGVTLQRAIIGGVCALAGCSDSTGPGDDGEPLAVGAYSFVYVDAQTTYSGTLNVLSIAPGDSAIVQFDVVEQGVSATRFGHPTSPISGFHLGTDLGDDVVPRFFFAPRRYSYDDIVDQWRPIATFIVHLSERAPADGNFCYFGNNFTTERLATECRVEAP